MNNKHYSTISVAGNSLPTLTMGGVFLITLLLLTAVTSGVWGNEDEEEFGIKEIPVSKALDDVTMNKVLPPLKGENWTPKQLFKIVSELSGVDIVFTQPVLQGPKLSPDFASPTLRQIMVWVREKNKAEYKPESSVVTRKDSSKADVRITMIKVYSKKEAAAEPVLKVERRVHLYNIEPEEALAQAYELCSENGRVYLSSQAPMLLLEDEPDRVMAMTNKIKQIDKRADEEVTRVVELKNRSAPDIVKEIEKMLPEQEGMLIPEIVGNKIYLRDTVEMANRLEKLIHSLDKGESVGEVKELSRAVKLQFSSAELIVADLLKLMPELDQTLKVNPVNNTITIRGDADRWDVVERMIRGLDNLNANEEQESQ